LGRREREREEEVLHCCSMYLIGVGFSVEVERRRSFEKTMTSGKKRITNNK